MAIQSHTRFYDRYVSIRPGAFRPWESQSRVGTQSDLLGLPAWEAIGIIRGSGGAITGGTATVDGLPTTTGGAPSTLNLTADPVVIYKIQVVSPAGAVLVASVPFLRTNQGLDLELNRAGTLRFRVAASASAVSSLVVPNRVVLRDRWGFVVGRFQIQKRTPVREFDATFYDFVCQDALAQLARDPVPYYETAEKSVQAILGDLMAMQVQGAPIAVGLVDAAIGTQTLAFYAQDTTVLGAINQLRDSLPSETAGHFYVDNSGALQWRLNIGLTGTLSTTAITGLRYETSHDEQITRIYLYGEGQDPRTRLKLTDAGEAEEYIEDAAAVATYGVLPAIRVEPSITDAATLLTVAQRILSEYKEPRVTLDIDVLDLAKAENADVYDTDLGINIAADDIYIGSTYTVTDTTLPINATVKVERISYNLDNPLPLRVELDNRRRRLDDFIAELVRKQNPPLNVNDDGSLYPTIGRMFDDDTGVTPDGYKNGDLRYGEVDNIAYMFYRDSNNGGAGDFGNTQADGPWTRMARDEDLQQKVLWVVIQDVFEDYLSCRRIDPATGDLLVGSFLVAKPWLLQQAPFNGETIEYIDGEEITYTKDATDPEFKRNHSDGVDNADFIITPNYFIGERILALNVPTNLTVSGSPVEFIELGMGRYWAREE